MTTARLREYEPTPDWFRWAACQHHPELDWHPEKGAPQKQQKAICRTCPVRIACINYALDNGEKWGIWGGYSEKQRRALRRDRNRAKLCHTQRGG